MTDWKTSDRDVDRVIRSWLHEDRHEDVSRIAGAVLTHVEATPQRRSAWWPARRTPIVNKMIGFGLAAAVALVIIVGAQLFGSRSNVGSGAEPTLTIQPTTDSSPGFSRFTSTTHGISIDYPSGWQIRPATEPWMGGALNFDSPAADVIFDPVLGDRLYILLASQSGRPDQFDGMLEQFGLIEDSGVCDPEGGMGGGSFTVDGASAWGQTCTPGISGANFVEAVAVTTDTRGYLIALVESGDEPGVGDAYDFTAALETVDLSPGEAR